jgi:hypothetical protein
MWPQAFLLLTAVGAAGAATVLGIVAALRGERRRVRHAALGVGVIAIGYMVLVVSVAAAAPDRTLAPGEEKYICELDCHLAYSVVGVRWQQDTVYVRLNIRFDRETISSRRPLDAPVYPGSRVVRLSDVSGRHFRPISLGDLRRSLLPGEAYQTEIAFEADPAAIGLVLFIADADPSKRVLIGSDNAFFRTPVGFRLSEK